MLRPALPQPGLFAAADELRQQWECTPCVAFGHWVREQHKVGGRFGYDSLSVEQYPDVARRIVEQCPGITHVAITLRESISASHNNWGAMLYAARQQAAFFAPLSGGRYHPYSITHIVDRVGAGDASVTTPFWKPFPAGSLRRFD